MSNYTTQLRYLIENEIWDKIHELTIDERILIGKKYVFDFNYPLFDESYRDIFEQNICKYYYDYEIAYETENLFKLKLNAKLNLIMPYYNKIYLAQLQKIDPFISTLFTETYNKKFNGENNITANTDNNTDSNLLSENSVNTDNTSKRDNTITEDNFNVSTDSPDTRVSEEDLRDNMYASAAQKDDNNSYQKDNISSNENTNGEINTINNVNNNIEFKSLNENTNVEDFVRKYEGYQNINQPSRITDLINSFVNVDLLVINELDPLFSHLF